MKIKRILVPTDFSENAELALKAIGTFVDLYGACIDLIHVVPLGKYFSESIDHLGLPLDMEKEVYPKVKSTAHKKLEALAVTYLKPEYIGHLHVAINQNPALAIYTLANKGDYDLVLMSARGRDESHFLRGSTSEKVIRHSNVPVLSIGTDLKISGIHNIVVPVDLSELSYKAIAPAFELALKFDAKITLFHVIELYAADVDGIAFVGAATSKEGVYSALIANINRFFSENEDTGLFIERTGVSFKDTLIKSDVGGAQKVDVDSVIERGISAHYQISEYANEYADMVVMTTHGRTGLAKLFLGSVAGQIVQHTDVPVLSIKPNVMKIKV